MRAGDELHAAAARMDIDDDVAQGKEGGAEEVRDLAGDGAFGISGKCAVHVHAVERREACGGACGGKVEGGDEDDASAHVVGCEFACEVHGGDLALVFVAVVASEHEGGGAFAAFDDGAGNHDVGPTAEVVGVGDLEEALLLTGFVEVEGGDDHYPVGMRFVCRARSGGSERF